MSALLAMVPLMTVPLVAMFWAVAWVLLGSTSPFPGGGGVLVTVSVALLLVTLPTELLTTTEKVEALSAAVVAGVT